MDIFVGSMHGRARWFFELVSTILMLSIAVLLVIGSSDHFWRAYTNGDCSFDICLPTWPAKLVVPVMLTVLCLRLILNLWGYIRAISLGQDSPVAVPLIEDAATQAAREAETVSGGVVDDSLDDGLNKKGDQ